MIVAERSAIIRRVDELRVFKAAGGFPAAFMYLAVFVKDAAEPSFFVFFPNENYSP